MATRDRQCRQPAKTIQAAIAAAGIGNGLTGVFQRIALRNKCLDLFTASPIANAERSRQGHRSNDSNGSQIALGCR